MREAAADLAALSALLDRSLGRREFEEFIDSGPVYARIDPERMFDCHIAETQA